MWPCLWICYAATSQPIYVNDMARKVTRVLLHSLVPCPEHPQCLPPTSSHVSSWEPSSNHTRQCRCRDSFRFHPRNCVHDTNHPWASTCDPFIWKLMCISWRFWILMGGPCLPPLDKIRYMTALALLSPSVSLLHPLSNGVPCSFSIWGKTNEDALHQVLLSYKSLSDAEYQKVKVLITQSCLALCNP